MDYATPSVDKAITSVVISMVGAMSIHDVKGERQHTIYIGEAPEHGKATLTERLEREIAQAKKCCPDAVYLGRAASC